MGILLEVEVVLQRDMLGLVQINEQPLPLQPRPDDPRVETLKRVPSPYPQNHPCADLLKHKGLALSAQPREGISATPAFVDWAEAKLRDAAPVVNWLDRNLR